MQLARTGRSCAGLLGPRALAGGKGRATITLAAKNLRVRGRQVSLNSWVSRVLCWFSMNAGLAPRIIFAPLSERKRQGSVRGECEFLYHGGGL